MRLLVTTSYSIIIATGLLYLCGPVAFGQIETGELKPVPKPFVETKASTKEEPIAKEKPSRLESEVGLSAVENPAISDDVARLGSSLLTQKEARTFLLTVPPPRGQILDRYGYPLAQTKVAFYAAINFPVLPDESESAIVAYARDRILHANKILGERFDIKTSTVVEHFKNRRWLPLVFSAPLTDDQVDEMRPNLMKGLMLHPTYQRHYPHNDLLAHVIGYVSNRPPRKTGPIENGEELWPTAVGANGLEEVYDTHLTGTPGRVNLLFDADGTKLKEEVIRRPRPGRNVITTIDLEMQQIAERLLAKHTQRGAIVIMDVRSGDVLTMASYPSYDLNDWVPSMPQERYQELTSDPDIPMISRAYQSAYPPASTFKVPVAIAALDSRAISPSSVYNCTTSYTVGDIVFHNWNKEPEGFMNVVGALSRSCNTFFYQTAVDTGVDQMSSMAQRLGFGEKTGLPLKGESAGFIPTNRWYREKTGYYMTDGDACNISIGQGTVLATPLQVARAMAAVGNRQQVMNPRLVMQVQDLNNDIVQAFPEERRNALNVEVDVLNVVRQGMIDVVNGGRGTGRKAANSKIEVAGKTGTGQWKITNEQNVAWFAGFAPAEYPVYAFAVLYEGNPGEKVGGGSKAAPVIGEFFEEYVKDEGNITKVEEASEAFEMAQSAFDSTATGEIYESVFQEDEVALGEEENSEDNVGPSPKKSGLSKWFSRFRRR